MARKQRKKKNDDSQNTPSTSRQSSESVSSLDRPSITDQTNSPAQATLSDTPPTTTDSSKSNSYLVVFSGESN